METGNIIAIYNKNKDVALQEFDSLMKKTNDSLNKAATNSNRFSDYDAKQLEKEVVMVMKNQCYNTPFASEDIVLISGQRFPDIVAGKHFGVEVKSTKENKWTSTGSSIIESTRVKDVNHIYMLFGKLGGSQAEFMCKPYQDCLCDIAVTHSPRYLIDMNLSNGGTIFSKMGVEYDEFRLSGNAIEEVRNYYIKKIKEKGQTAMPWWINQDLVTSPTLMLWSEDNMTRNEALRLRAEMLLLFPKEICSSNFNRAALWLCIRHSIINTHFRDLFTAGGKVIMGNRPYPRIVGWILNLAPIIKELLDDGYLWQDLLEYNPEIIQTEDKYACWINQISEFYPIIKKIL